MKLLKSEEKIVQFLQLNDLMELLFIFPYRYDNNELEDFSNWKINDKVFFNGLLLSKPRTAYFNRRSSSRFQVEYQGNIIDCTIYNRKWISSLEPGININIEGKYSGINRVTVSNYNTNKLESSLGMFPVYSLTSGVTISSYRKFLKKVFNKYQSEIVDEIPADITEKYRLLPLVKALEYIHFPKNFNEVKLAVRTLKYREFLLFNLANEFNNLENRNTLKLAKSFDSEDVFKLANSLNFNLTKDQFTSLNEIIYDLNSNKLMNRLLQGDVGSGKTVVAALAMYANILAGYQAAFMVPTEILAIQQYEYFKELFKNHNINVVCLYSALKTYKKNEIIKQIENGDADIIVGTHALIQTAVNYSNLGLVIVDEQQRFGVNQRSSLFEKGILTDRLLMSATPIPRTMASVLFSSMDVSTIETMPNDRIPIKTAVIDNNSMKSILDDLISLINEGSQVYVVCPAIEASDESSLSDVDTIYQSLNIALNERKNLDIKIAKLHGKMDAKEKELIMKDFEQKKYDILVSTTVIEVGINVKNANAMVIYNANSFGLSQLHQLRGRVGRGHKQAYCYLLDKSTTIEQREKIEFLASTNNGFEISEYDLNLRGPGDVLGIRQSGIPNFVLGDLTKDKVMLDLASKDAKMIINDLDNKSYRDIIRKVMKDIERK